MLLLRLYFLVLSALPLLASAQSVPPGRPTTLLDLTAASGPSLRYGSAAGWRLWGLGSTGHLQAGLGVRGSYYFADNLLLDRQGGSDGGPTGLAVAAPRLGALNVAFAVRARVAGPLSAGFNLDVAGLSFGPERAGTYPGAGGGPAALRPTSPNLLLGGTNDRGSLNSELYVSLAFAARLSLRAGYTHQVAGYEADGARYRRFHNLALLGLSYQLP